MCIRDSCPGCGAHTDWGLLTLLIQDDVGGLEVRLPGGGQREDQDDAASKSSWIHVPPRRDGALLANVGDMLRRWTAGRYRSAPHRVLRPLGGGGGGGDDDDDDDGSGADRYSAAFFINGNADAVIDPARLGLGLGLLPPDADADGSPKAQRWRPITSMEYILERVAATYSD